jgi:hypothetical protein
MQVDEEDRVGRSRAAHDDHLEPVGGGERRGRAEIVGEALHSLLRDLAHVQCRQRGVAETQHTHANAQLVA